MKKMTMPISARKLIRSRISRISRTKSATWTTKIMMSLRNLKWQVWMKVQLPRTNCWFWNSKMRPLSHNSKQTRTWSYTWSGRETIIGTISSPSRKKSWLMPCCQGPMLPKPSFKRNQKMQDWARIFYQKWQIICLRTGGKLLLPSKLALRRKSRPWNSWKNMAFLKNCRRTSRHSLTGERRHPCHRR